MSEIDTKARILDAAEKLFANKGFPATSIRNVIREANVNTASVHYHFGSREGLIAAVLSRRAAPMNDERLKLLDAVEAAHSTGPLPLEEVVETFVGPTVRLHFDPDAGGSMFPRLMARAITDADVGIHDMLVRVFGTVFGRYMEAFRRALPGLSPPEIAWRIHFMIGALAFTIAIPSLHSQPGQDKASFDDGAADRPPVERQFGRRETADIAVRRLVGFVSAGMRACVQAEAQDEVR